MLVSKKHSIGEPKLLSKKDSGSSFFFRSGTMNSSAIAAAIGTSKTPRASALIDPNQITVLPTPEKRKAFIFSGLTLKHLQEENPSINLLHNSFATDRHNSELSHKTHESKER
ncbi:MAG: hypothetical protein EOO43_24690, partial [Flavobacterium sp.]